MLGIFSRYSEGNTAKEPTGGCDTNVVDNVYVPALRFDEGIPKRFGRITCKKNKNAGCGAHNKSRDDSKIEKDLPPFGCKTHDP